MAAKRPLDDAKAIRKPKRKKEPSDADVNPNPMPLIYCEDGRYVFNEDAAAVLEKMQSPFGVVSVVGKYRTGKSFLLNRVLLQSEGFGVGCTIQAHTKGLWFSPKPITCTDERGVQFPAIVIDTEGISALDANSTHDTKVFCLALLLSSFFIYNSVGSIDEEALNTLSLVVKISENIRRAGGDARNACQDAAFLWVVRDFSLQLRDGFNQVISEQEYLENALRETSDTSSEKNKIRRCLKEFFVTRYCKTLVRPCENEEHLQGLDKMPNSILRDVFVSQMNRLRTDILGAVRPKRAAGHVLTGPLFSKLCREYTESINKGAAPAIRSTLTMLSESQCRLACDAAIAAFKKSFVIRAFPVQLSSLAEALKICRTAALAEFEAVSFGDEAPLFRLKLQDSLEAEEGKLHDTNKQALQRVVRSSMDALQLAVETECDWAGIRRKFDGMQADFFTKYPGYEGAWAEAAVGFLWDAATAYTKSKTEVTTEKHNALQKKYDELHGSMCAKLNDAYTQAASQAADVVKLELRCAELDRSVGLLTEEAQYSAQRIGELEADKATLIKQGDSATQDAAGLQERLLEAEEKAQALTDASVREESASRKFQAELIQCVEELKSAQAAERETYRAKTKQHGLAMEDLTGKLNIVQQQLSNADAQLERKGAELSAVQEQLQASVKQREEDEAKYAHLLKQNEQQCQESLGVLRSEMENLKELQANESLTLIQSVHAAESRAMCAEARLQDHSRQLELARNTEGPKVAAVQSALRDVTSQLQRSQSENAHLKDMKEELTRRLREATSSNALLTMKCQDMSSQYEKEVTSVKVTYERRIGVLEQRLAEYQ